VADVWPPSNNLSRRGGGARGCFATAVAAAKHAAKVPTRRCWGPNTDIGSNHWCQATNYTCKLNVGSNQNRMTISLLS